MKQTYLFAWGTVIFLIVVSSLFLRLNANLLSRDSISIYKDKLAQVMKMSPTADGSKAIVLPNYFGALGTKFISTENSLVFVTQDYQFNGDIAETSDRYLLSLPLNDLGESDGLRTDSPMNEQEYPSISVIQLNNKILMFGFKLLSEPEEYPQFSKNADAYMATISDNGEIGSWQRLNIGLPPNIPLENGGYFIKTNGKSIFAVVVEDRESFRIYELKMNDGNPAGWNLIGELPRPTLGYISGHPASFQFLSDKILTVSDKEIVSYSYTNGKIGNKLATFPIKMQDSNIDYEQMYVSADDKSILILLPVNGENKKVSINLYKADLDDVELLFNKIDSIDPEIDSDNLQEVMYSQNASTLFILIHDLGQNNEVSLRKLFTIPVY